MSRTRTGARGALVAFGALFLAQGIAKAVDPVGYMTAIDAFHVLAPSRFGALSLGALGLGWTVLELLAGVAMLYGGLARAPRTKVPLVGILLALGVSFTYFALDAGALSRHVHIENSTTFGAWLAQPLSPAVLVQQAALMGVLAWLFMRVMWWWTPRYLRSRISPAPSA